MARRNPVEVAKNKYFRNLKFRKIYPILFYYKCVKCGNEFCREPMYECQERDARFGWSQYYQGCTCCFNNKEGFRKCLEDKQLILTENGFVLRR